MVNNGIVVNFECFDGVVEVIIGDVWVVERKNFMGRYVVEFIFV